MNRLQVQHHCPLKCINETATRIFVGGVGLGSAVVDDRIGPLGACGPLCADRPGRPARDERDADLRRSDPASCKRSPEAGEPGSDDDDSIGHERRPA